MTRRNATTSACTNGDALSYDQENKLTSITVGANTTTYVGVYRVKRRNGDGNRVKKTVNGVSTYYIGNHYEVTNNVATKYYYFGKQRVAMRVGTNPTIYLHSDHLGNTSATSGASVSAQKFLKTLRALQYLRLSSPHGRARVRRRVVVTEQM